MKNDSIYSLSTNLEHDVKCLCEYWFSILSGTTFEILNIQFSSLAGNLLREWFTSKVYGDMLLA